LEEKTDIPDHPTGLATTVLREPQSPPKQGIVVHSLVMVQSVQTTDVQNDDLLVAITTLIAQDRGVRLWLDKTTQKRLLHALSK
jgi:hypothetical protein